MKSVQTDKIALQKEMSGMVDRLRDRSDIVTASVASSNDVTIEIGDENDLTEIIIN